MRCSLPLHPQLRNSNRGHSLATKFSRQRLFGHVDHLLREELSSQIIVSRKRASNSSSTVRPMLQSPRREICSSAAGFKVGSGRAGCRRLLRALFSAVLSLSVFSSSCKHCAGTRFAGACVDRGLCLFWGQGTDLDGDGDVDSEDALVARVLHK